MWCWCRGGWGRAHPAAPLPSSPAEASDTPVRVLLLKAINLTGCTLVLFRDPINCRQQNTQSRRTRVVSSMTHLLALVRPWDQLSIVSSESFRKPRHCFWIMFIFCTRARKNYTSCALGGTLSTLGCIQSPYFHCHCGHRPYSKFKLQSFLNLFNSLKKF